MAVVLIFNHVYWFSQKNTLGNLVTMATRKRLFLIYKIENFANTQFWKVTKFQRASLFRCGVLSHLLGMGWKTPPPPVLIGLNDILPCAEKDEESIDFCFNKISKGSSDICQPSPPFSANNNSPKNVWIECVTPYMLIPLKHKGPLACSYYHLKHQFSI